MHHLAIDVKLVSDLDAYQPQK